MKYRISCNACDYCLKAGSRYRANKLKRRHNRKFKHWAIVVKYE